MRRSMLHAGRSTRVAPRGHAGVADIFCADVRSILMCLWRILKVQESHGVGITKPKDDGTFMGLAGLSAGPAILFNNATAGTSPAAAATRTAIAIGPLDNVKLTTSVMTRANNATWEVGVSSEIKSAPEGFVHRTLLVTSTGPTRAMLAWGEMAQKAANLTARFRDLATTKLGYFTESVSRPTCSCTRASIAKQNVYY